jgi:hypothetical protein
MCSPESNRLPQPKGLSASITLPQLKGSTESNRLPQPKGLSASITIPQLKGSTESNTLPRIKESQSRIDCLRVLNCKLPPRKSFITFTLVLLHILMQALTLIWTDRLDPPLLQQVRLYLRFSSGLTNVGSPGNPPS